MRILTATCMLALLALPLSAPAAAAEETMCLKVTHDPPGVDYRGCSDPGSVDCATYDLDAPRASVSGCERQYGAVCVARICWRVLA